MDCVEQEFRNLHFSGDLPLDASLQHIECAVKQEDQSLLQELIQKTKPSLQAFWLFRSAPQGVQLCEKALEVHPSYLTQRDDNMQTLLHHAAKLCDLDVCRLLLDRGGDVNARDICKNTPLLLVVIENGKSSSRLAPALGVIRHLIDANASVDATNLMGSTPFLEAVFSENVTMAQELVEAGANMWYTNQYGNTSLMLSCCSSSMKCFEFILKQDNCTEEFINKQNENGVTALHIAVCMRSVTKTRMLLEKGADSSLGGSLEWFDVLDAVFPMATDCEFVTHSSVLWYAYMVQSVDIIECLAEFGCDVNGMTREGMSLLHQCAIDGNTGCARVLINLGASANQMTSSAPLTTPLSLATSEGQVDMVRFLLSCGADVNKLIEDGRTAIFSAYDSPDIMKLLIEHGADVNVVDVNGMSALACAVKCNCYKAAKLLLLHGADVNTPLPATRMWLGEPSLLFVEVKRCPPNLPMLQLLLDYGIEVNLVNDKGQTALMCLIRQKYANHQSVRALLESGADVGIRDGFGRNVFYTNVHSTEALPIAKLLSEAGADCNCLDKNNDTPLAFAIGSHSNYDVFALLKVNCDLKRKKHLRLAVLSEQYSISVMLYLAGCDVNEVNLWTKVKDTLQYRVPVNNSKLLEFVKDITSRPPALKLLCRRAVRECIASAISLHLLPVPKVIQQYLDLADLEPLLLV